MENIIVALWCVIGDGVYHIGTEMRYWLWFILSRCKGLLLVMVYIIMVLWCVIGDGLYYHGTVVCC